MDPKVLAEKYMNIMALALSLISRFKINVSEIRAYRNYSIIAERQKTILDSLWEASKDDFIDAINEALEKIQQIQSDLEKKICLMEFCVWLDLRITYASEENNSEGTRQFVSLYPIIPITASAYIEIGALNTNWKDTNIWINPKFSIADTHVIRNGISKKKKISNRDIFDGLNGILENCSYIECDKKKRIRNIIIPTSCFGEQEKDAITIAFAPMTDRNDNFVTKRQMIKRAGIPYNGLAVEEIKNADILLDRLKTSWELAADVGADIFFAPEMLGSELSETGNEHYNMNVRAWSIARMKECRNIPILTILPSYWSNNSNRATILSNDERILARQEKYVPYIDVKNNMLEALEDRDEWQTVLIHIPGMHRIAILICAEFLADQDRVRKYICGSLGTTLLIVPSYTAGEQDFINLLPNLKPYGTTVVWGNCCGAVMGDKKAIGGCGLAGTAKTLKMGDVCKCNFSCKGVAACVYKISLSLNQEVKKIEEDIDDEIIQHEIR